MMRSLYSGVSGLKNHQTRMDVVGNNISNVNTTGFKSSRVTFADTLSQTLSGAASPQGNLGGINPKQIGLGSALSAIDTLFTDGSVQSTGVNTDLCLSGNGLFIVKDGDLSYYTRNGNFKFDKDGYYVNSDGMKVAGWCADKPGSTYDTKTQPGTIKIEAGETMAAEATQESKFTKNLDSAEALIETLKAIDGKGNTITTIAGGNGVLGVGQFNQLIEKLSVEFISPAGVTTASLADTLGSYAMGQTYNITNLKATNQYNDTITIPSTATETYTQGSSVSPSLTVQSINGGTVTYSNGVVMTLNAPATATSTVRLANGDSISVPATLATNYTVGAIPGVTVTNVTGNTVTLSDGTFFTAGNAALYTPGSALPSSVASISCNHSSGRLTSIKGYISGVDEVDVTSVVPSAGLSVEVTGMKATTSGECEIEISNNDLTAYQKGMQYQADVSAVTMKMSNGEIATETSGTYRLGHSKPLTTIMEVYDSLGNVHNVTVYMTKTKVDSNLGNQWTISVNTDGSGRQIITGKDGKETVVTMRDAVVQFNTTGGYSDGNGVTTLELTNGATGTQKVSMDFTGLTQYAGSNTAFASTDGNAAGTLKSVSIDSAGVITGTYTNGLNIQRGQIAIAQFNNASGLTKTGNSLYTESNNSGTPNIGTIRDLGCTVTPSALEMSNVDMASELTDMIVTQRGYQSNSKIITVSDELLETLINMKR